ncbi:MAG: xanthine dehydrogenase family protein [Pseudolabrys sp.]|nr:xanthine dehydrogenase family protein [Pseudolabrys sp.]
MLRRRNTLVGQPVMRVEDARLLAGGGMFVDDIDPPGLAHAAILRSSIAHGRIVSIDTEAARAQPGVHAIITAQDLDGKVPTIPVRMAPVEGQARYLQPVIATDKVRYVGEPLAVVVADSRGRAEDVLELIGVEIEHLTPVADVAMADAAPLFEPDTSNVCVSYSVRVGDAAAAFAQADYTRAERFQVHRHSALPMETRGLVAAWDTERTRLTIWGAAKVPYFNRRTLAAMLGLTETSIELIELDVGGGFGVRGEFYPEDFLIPFAARRIGRPVKWIEDRREHLMATNHSREVACNLEIACRRDGTILGLRGQLTADMGAYIRTTGIVIPSRAAQFLPGPYRVPSMDIHVQAVLTNKTPAGSYRGPGRFEANFFRERLFDIAARELALDPVEFRRRNLLNAGEMPYDYGRLAPYDSPVIYDSGDYHLTLDRCLAEIKWNDKRHLQGALVDGRYHGLGIVCFVESSGSGKENARITLASDGIVRVAVGSSALGQGIATGFVQVTADALGLPMERIAVLHRSTSRLDQGFGSFHGRSMVMGASAIVDAADKLLHKLRTTAAERFCCAAHDIELCDGLARAPDGRSVAFEELASSTEPLQADGSFASSRPTYSYGAHAAHVAVDPETGQVEVIDYVSVEDVGRMINPRIVRGQKIGAIVQGLGGTFLDHLVYDGQAQLLTGSLADYLVPTASDFPNVRAVSLEHSPAPDNPLGVKGAGEDGIISVGAVVANAVAAALSSLGCEVTALPLSPPRVWQIIERVRRRG